MLFIIVIEFVHWQVCVSVFHLLTELSHFCVIVTFFLSPLLFQINAEFKRITTGPLQSKFLSQLDLHSENLTQLFQKRGGQLGGKLKRIAAQIANASNTEFIPIILSYQSLRD